MEVKGIVDALDSKELDVSKVILFNMLYELDSWSTSIVAKYKANSTI